nr:MAG TPA: hypothetical protein [Caudoviricetes sp.]
MEQCCAYLSCNLHILISQCSQIKVDLIDTRCNHYTVIST